MRVLAERCEPFRDMCEELAAAEAALMALPTDAPAAERRTECEGWITRLTEEIAEAISRSEVVRLSDRRPR